VLVKTPSVSKPEQQHRTLFTSELETLSILWNQDRLKVVNYAMLAHKVDVRQDPKEEDMVMLTFQKASSVHRPKR